MMPQAFLFLSSGVALHALQGEPPSFSIRERQHATRDQLYATMALHSFVGGHSPELAVFVLVCCIAATRNQFLSREGAGAEHIAPQHRAEPDEEAPKPESSSMSPAQARAELGFESAAQPDVPAVEKEFRKIALKHHPDRNQGASVAERKESEEKFQRANEAKEVLSE